MARGLLPTLLFVITIPAVYGTVIEPFSSVPGTTNRTIIVFLDLHRSYHDNGTCSDPDWGMYELAAILEWKSSFSNNTLGLEIYDTCQSIDRALEIIRQKFLGQTCAEDKKEIAGALSYVSSDVGNLINDTLHLKGILYVDIKQKATEESKEPITNSLLNILNQIKWTYITTFADDSELSQAEHSRFLHIAKEQNICIQYSVSENSSQIPMSAVKTPGVVVFTSDLSNVVRLLKDLPTKYGVVIVTHDRNEVSFNITNKVLILSYGYNPLINISDIVKQVLDRVRNISSSEIDMQGISVFRDYFVSRHNCSWDSSGDFFSLTCENISAIESYFMTRPSKTDINTVVHELNIMDATIQNSSARNDESTRILSLAAYSDGIVHKTVTDSLTFTPDVSQIVNDASFTFPSSQCTGWCPSCTTCTGHVAYDGDYRHFAGDFLVAGLFPIREKGEQVFACGSAAFNEFSDIYAAAFVFAIETAQRRSPGLLPNVTLGGIIFDTCSDNTIASRTLLNFESCLYSFEPQGNTWPVSPQIVPGYIMPNFASDDYLKTFSELGKLGIAVHPNGALTVNNEDVYSPVRFNYSAIVHLLEKMDWTFVGIVTSADFDKYTLNGFLENTLAKNICVAYRTEISATNQNSIHDAISTVRQYDASAVIFFAKPDAVRDFFRALTYKPVNKVWVLVETRENYFDFSDISPPLGSIIFQKKGKQNTEFNQYYAAEDRSVASTGNPWKAFFKAARDKCVSPSCTRKMASADTWMRASDIIKSVDIMLHAAHNTYTKLCPTLEGLCYSFLESGSSLIINETNSVNFEYQDDTVQFADPNSVLEGYSISNVQSNGLVQIGSWSTQGLDLDKEIIKFYTFEGDLIERNIGSYCYAKCNCINNYTTENNTGEFEAVELDPEMGFVDSSAEFDSKLWTIIVVIIALSGCVVTLGLMMYIMCKVCAGALIRRYLALGVLLLVAMIFLFLSVLPFVFTPSEVGCGMRFFAHGFSYAFCYAIILTKMTTLRDYKYIGLGGEISRLNQFLSVFFITGVQIAVGVQWWVLGGPTLSQITIKEKTSEGIENVTYYACDFNRKEFITYHSYVLLLLVICCFYSIGVRKETKNMKEARLLLICSWFCLALWIAVIVTFLILQRDYLEAIAAIGILANALSMIVIIYLPKLTVIAKLKYEISEKSGKRVENGYKVDTDFQFERPYSLPGTMHSSYTDKTNTLPRSLAAFDTSLSY